MKFRNFTPHDIKVETKNGEVETFPSEGVARLGMTQIDVSNPADEFNFFSNIVNACEGLPSQEDGVKLIVSSMVLEAMKGERSDLLAPNTTMSKRNDKGHIISVKGFVK